MTAFPTVTLIEFVAILRIFYPSLQQWTGHLYADNQCSHCKCIGFRHLLTSGIWCGTFLLCRTPHSRVPIDQGSITLFIEHLTEMGVDDVGQHTSDKMPYINVRRTILNGIDEGWAKYINSVSLLGCRREGDSVLCRQGHAIFEIANNWPSLFTDTAHDGGADRTRSTHRIMQWPAELRNQIMESIFHKVFNDRAKYASENGHWINILVPVLHCASDELMRNIFDAMHDDPPTALLINQILETIDGVYIRCYDTHRTYPADYRWKLLLKITPLSVRHELLEIRRQADEDADIVNRIKSIPAVTDVGPRDALVYTLRFLCRLENHDIMDTFIRNLSCNARQTALRELSGTRGQGNYLTSAIRDSLQPKNAST